MNKQELIERLQAALPLRQALLDEEHTAAVRVFNGFVEDVPGLAVDCYARTLVVMNQANPAENLEVHMSAIIEFYRAALPWLECGVLKTRHTLDAQAKRGELLWGSNPARKIREHGVWYAVDLLLNQDCSFYLDTRGLRQWILANLAGKRVLNTFAYTGSLGVAAASAGASRVLQTDLNRVFLNLGMESLKLNNLPARPEDFWASDFFAAAAGLKRKGETFDCVLLDPPFFSSTAGGRVDLVNESVRMVNKVRPLVAHNGWIVMVNNALFLSGQKFMDGLQALCAGGYLSIEALIPVPADTAGYKALSEGALPSFPAPFNHATKIAVIRVKKKDAGE